MDECWSLQSLRDVCALLNKLTTSFAYNGRKSFRVADDDLIVEINYDGDTLRKQNCKNVRMFRNLTLTFPPSEKGAQIARETHGTPVRKEHLTSMTSGCGEISVTTTLYYNPPGVASRIEVSINTNENLSTGQVMDLIRRVLNIFGKE